MTTIPLLRRALAEFIGTGLLVAAGVGSGISAQRLTDDPGLALLTGSVTATLALTVLILLFAPVSGGHINPAVSITIAAISRRTGTGPDARALAVYIPVQVLGGICGGQVANAMFQVPPGISTAVRADAGTLLGEFVATAGLMLLVGGMIRAKYDIRVIAVSAGAYIGAAIWFTSSAFANPAITIAQIFTGAGIPGIEPVSALAFIAVQLAGTALGIVLANVLFPGTAPISPVPQDQEAEEVLS